MLDGILGRGFSSKCKSLIKPTYTRIDVLRRKKEATQRFLKGNLAQLLSNGLDINAFGRTEEFIAGLNILSCYDFIEKCCEYILKQLSVMQKLRECPEECRGAVGSLMFAAARFSDLPELRDLRDAFQERYGSSLEHFANREFVEKLALRPPTMDKKIQLLQDIASEFSIKWDSRGFERRMANPSALPQDQPKKYVPVNDDKHELPSAKETLSRADKQPRSSKKRTELVGEGHRVHNDGIDYLWKNDDLGNQFIGRDELTGNKHKPAMGSEQTKCTQESNGLVFHGRGELTKLEGSLVNKMEDIDLKGFRTGSSSHGKKQEFGGGGYEVQNDGVCRVSKTDGQGIVSDGKSEFAARVTGVTAISEGKTASAVGYNGYDHPSTSKPTNKVEEEGTERQKPSCSSALPPPYIKSKDKLIPPPYTKNKDSKYRVNSEAKPPSVDLSGNSMDPSMHKIYEAVSKSERNRGESDHPNKDQVVGHARLHNHAREKDFPYHDDIPLPKPRSVRRKHSKSSSRDDLVDSEDAGVVKRSSSSRRRDGSRRGLQILFDEQLHRKDEEEKVIDKLLLHYSRKPSTFEPEKPRRKSKSHTPHQIAADAGETSHSGRDRADVRDEIIPPPTRSVSLPRAQRTPEEPIKVYARANSFQADQPAPHVHPKLPDYDDLAARFSALRGR
ncbi:hypothetical protein NMG60_11021849 [Bertholletia excelsa]